MSAIPYCSIDSNEIFPYCNIDSNEIWVFSQRLANYFVKIYLVRRIWDMLWPLPNNNVPVRTQIITEQTDDPTISVSTFPCLDLALKGIVWRCALLNNLPLAACLIRASTSTFGAHAKAVLRAPVTYKWPFSAFLHTGWLKWQGRRPFF